MPPSEPDRARHHISQIETIWTAIYQAHGNAPGEATVAQHAILERYRPAIVSYLVACLGNKEAAGELFQEFALRFLRGDFRNANPEKGRFRDLLKTAPYHLVVDHHKRINRQPSQLAADGPEPEALEESIVESDRQFLEAWRTDLLNRAWEKLAAEESRSGRPLHTVLSLRSAQPDLRSPEMARMLSNQRGKEVSADWVRKWLHAARERYADFLMDEVAVSLKEPGPDSVEQELIDLGLYEYCRSAIARWRQAEQTSGDG